ncbi:MAG: C-GCAxxG-C-C family protein [Clostridioides sp.]|nr:C-GCAxxG-C-C family protein [Clostridioides sp.]
MEDKMKASKFHGQGLNCAECVIKAYNEEHGTDIPVAIGSGLGGGNAVGSLCGAVNAANIIIGYLKGRENGLEANIAKPCVKKAMDSIDERYGTAICLELKEDKNSCDEIIDFAYDNLKNVMDNK